jgi:hypothetical protein
VGSCKLRWCSCSSTSWIHDSLTAFASLITDAHSSHSAVFNCHLLIFKSYRSLSTLSNHLSLCFRFSLFPSVFSQMLNTLPWSILRSRLVIILQLKRQCNSNSNNTDIILVTFPWSCTSIIYLTPIMIRFLKKYDLYGVVDFNLMLHFCLGHHLWPVRNGRP